MQRKTTITALLCLVAATACLCAGCGDTKPEQYNPQKFNNFFMMGKYDQALEVARKDAKDFPDNHNAHYNLGQALCNNLKPAEAVAAFDRAVALEPKHAESHYLKAFCLIATDKEDDAKAAFEKALESYQVRVDASSKNAAAMADCAVCLFFLGKRDEALEMCNKAIKTENNNTFHEKKSYIIYNNEFGQLYPEFVKEFKGKEWLAKKEAEAKALNKKIEEEEKAAKEAAAKEADTTPDEDEDTDEDATPDADEDVAPDEGTGSDE